jgi:sterol 3beta-glucosyltransferase
MYLKSILFLRLAVPEDVHGCPSRRAGTAATGLRAGVPSVSYHSLPTSTFGPGGSRTGCGTKAISRKKLSAERLATAINEVLGDKKMKTRAAALGRAIRSEDGVGQAVRDIHDHFPMR